MHGTYRMVTTDGDAFDKFPYLGGGPKHPDWDAKNRKKRAAKKNK